MILLFFDLIYPNRRSNKILVNLLEYTTILGAQKIIFVICMFPVFLWTVVIQNYRNLIRNSRKSPPS